MPANSYDPTRVNIFAKTHRIVGFAEGTMINGSRNTDKQSLNIGSKGEATFVQSADKSGTVEITLKHNSASLEYLNRLFKTGEKFPLTAGYAGGSDRISGTEAKVASMGDYERSDDVSDKTITILVADYDEFY
ncbi:MAG: phage structural protein [Halanaerobiales bacterium]